MTEDRQPTPGQETSAPGGDSARTPAGDALTDLVLPVFELNGEFLAAAEQMTRPVGLTPAWWQVLGATLDEALPVAEIARRVGLGLARQSVQRVADVLVERGWAVYRDNPGHRRAKLLEPTAPGRSALRRLAAAQHEWADTVAEAVGEADLRRALAIIRRVIDSSRRYREGHADGGEAAVT
ncbi:MarR family winged helix-turn-helix transcriptional regulator [Geodermatophilus sp. URMC 61]|uniref:MarR family winged helix-turn-helix transcriptional regulator n=1 Tax=Geodermatophilus sp. URMC 61 TaxID=3423411 RepID=UPI00406D1572